LLGKCTWDSLKFEKRWTNSRKKGWVLVLSLPPPHREGTSEEETIEDVSEIAQEEETEIEEEMTMIREAADATMTVVDRHHQDAVIDF
jgi:hypothetical protein